MKSLNETGVRNSTDKSSLNHHYLELYEILFSPITKLTEQRILEIGVQFGNSLRTWKDYFSSPVIVGIDSVNNGVEIENVITLIGDAYDYRMVVKASTFGEFDIIIDDGDHEPMHQAFAIEHYSELLSHNGLLIVEDVKSKDVVYTLKSSLPKGFQYAVVDMTEGNSTVDSRLFIMWRRT